MATDEGGPVTAGRTIRWATLYDPLVAILLLGRAGALRRRTLGLAGLAPGEAVLDVGCGTGDLTLLAAGAVGPAGRACGVDAAPEMVAVARRKAAQAGGGVDYRLAAVEALPFPDASFDAVLSSLMMHHLPAELKRRGLAEVRRVLRPGGRLVIVDLRRPATRRGRALMALTLHGALGQGVQDLTGPLAAAGFGAIETGALGVGLLGFARCRVANGAAAVSETAWPTGVGTASSPREQGRGSHRHASLPALALVAALVAAALIVHRSSVPLLALGAWLVASHLLLGGFAATLVAGTRRRWSARRIARAARGDTPDGAAAGGVDTGEGA